jgi:hypothetical protein
MLKLYILSTFAISPYTTVSHGGGGYGCVQQFPEQAMTKCRLPSPFPLSPPAQAERMHTTKSASCCQNTNLLSNLWMSRLFTCRAENGVQCFGETDDAVAVWLFPPI